MNLLNGRIHNLEVLNTEQIVFGERKKDDEDI